MIKRFFKTLCFLLAALLVTGVANADMQVGKLLADAMYSKETCTIAEVSDKFLAAADSTSNRSQKSRILFLLSDYLLAHREWEKVIPVQYRILDCGDQSSQGGALYNLILANLEINQVADAKKAAAGLNACSSGVYMREYAHSMKKSSPDSIHAKISDLLSSTLPSQLSVPDSWNYYYDGSKKVEPSVVTSHETRPYSESLDPAVFPPATPANRKLAMLGGWNTELKGELDSQGMSLNFNNDLSKKRQTSMVFAAEADLSDEDRIKVTYVNFSFSGTLNKKMVHDAKTYFPGASFKLRTKFIDLEGSREIRESRMAIWSVLYGLVLAESDLKVTQYFPGIRQVNTWDSRFGYPYLGLAARSNSRGNVGWSASAKLFSWGGNGRYNTHDYEFKILLGQASERYSAKNLRGYVGYRDFRWEGDFDEDSAGVRFSGPIFGLEYLF